MFKNTMHFNYLYPSFNELNMIVTKMKLDYETETQEVFVIYKKLLQSFDEELYYKMSYLQKDIIIKYIKRILDIFPQLKNIPISIFLHGSFSKGLNRRYSDIDLNFIYPEKYKSKLFPVEELIALMITEVLGLKSRDHIHNMMIYGVKEDNLKKYSNYIILFKDGGELKYTVRDTKQHLINRIYISKRNIDSFLSYIKVNLNKNFINEWCYSILPIKKYDDYNILEKFNKLRKNNSILNKEYYKQMAIKELKILNESVDVSFSNNEYYVRYLNILLKKHYKDIVIRFLVIYNEIYLECSNIDYLQLVPFLKKDNNINNFITHYIWLIMRIEEVCHVYDLDFSYKSQKIISKETFGNYYLELFGINFDKEFNQIIKNLKQQIIACYERMIE